MAAGFRPPRIRCLKFGYVIEHESGNPDGIDHAITIQFVTSFRVFGFAGR